MTPKVTVATTTYNRAALLPRVHAGLVAQTFRDFEWVVVDDGSEDGTRDVIAELEKKSDFPIRYEWQPNSGRHAALNRAVELARGEYYTCVDSDDWYLPTALKTFMRIWQSIPRDQLSRFWDVVGLCVDPSGKIVGNKYPRDPFDVAYADYVRLGLHGDRSGCERVDCLRQYPFPVFEGERIPLEGIVFRRVGKHYLMRCFNEPTMVKEYQSTGLSARSKDIFVDSPKTATLYLSERLGDGDRGPKLYANHFRYALHAKLGRTTFRKSPSKLRWAATAPIGTALYVRDRLRRASRRVA